MAAFFLSLSLLLLLLSPSAPSPPSIFPTQSPPSISLHTPDQITAAHSPSAPTQSPPSISLYTPDQITAVHSPSAPTQSPPSISLLASDQITAAHSPSASPTQSPPSIIVSPPSPAQSPPSILSPLDPKQIAALRSLNLLARPDPCRTPNGTVQCDASSPFRHVVSLSLFNCPKTLSLSPLASLPTLASLSLASCHVSPVRLPSTNLRSFSVVDSFSKPLTGVWLSRLSNLTSLTVVNSAVNASGPTIVLYGMRKLEKLVITDANLTGTMPRHWKSLNLTLIDLSNNGLKGNIPTSISGLENLESLDLSNNRLEGVIPTSIGDISGLKNLSLSFNSISGTMPSEMPKELEHLDLGSNRLNGTIPHFISSMTSLKYLNLEKNNFEGVMPFNASFIKSLKVFKISGNSNLCYNHSIVTAKLKLGIARCDKHGLPIPPPPPKDSGGDDDDGSDDDYEDDTSGDKIKSNSHGANKVVLGVAIGLSAVVFLIIFCVLVSKCCR